MKKFTIALIACFIYLQVCAQSGSITINTVQQRSDGSGLVDVYYSLAGSESSYFLNMRVSFDAGITYYPVAMNAMSGDVGEVSPGNNKHIIWNPTTDHPNRFSPQTKLKITAYLVGISNPCPGNPTLTDIDGNIYHTVQIGDQCWMASNLNVTRKPNGEALSRLCYNNIPENCDDYGGLYDWNTAKVACPQGWHLPSDDEWTQLTNFLINNYVDITASNVGNKLKSCRQQDSPLEGDCNTTEHPRWNTNASHYGTNDFGFSALPGGHYSSGPFSNLGTGGSWWSATESSTYAWSRHMYSSNGTVTRGNNNKSYGFSLRCLRD